MMTTIISLTILALGASGASGASVGASGAVGALEKATTTRDISGGFSVVLPQNNCGYTDVQFNTSLNGNLQSNDTMWFYETLLPSNCGPQDTDLGCVSEMYMTGPYSQFGRVPYTVWYYFRDVGTTTLVDLYYNYNNSATHLVGSVPCDVEDYQMTLSPCMFNELLYSYEFYVQYKFNFYLSCSKDENNNIAFNLDQEGKTCIGGVDCDTVDNRFNLVNFDNWYLDNAYVDNGAGDKFCPPPPPPPPETTTTTVETPTSTETPTETPTGPPCKSCGNIIITVVNTNTNTLVS